MKKKYLKSVLCLLLLVFGFNLNAQNSSLWTKTTKERVSVKELNFRKTEPFQAQFYDLNIIGLKQQLQNAPQRSVVGSASTLIVKFPVASGVLEQFKITEASVMEDALQNQYPTLRSYSGESIENPGTLIRFSVTNKGLHTMLYSPKNGTEFIDPYSKDGKSYIVYSKKDLPALDSGFTCHYENTDEDNERLSNAESLNFNANDGRLRNFRIAIATTIEYSQFHWMAAGLTAASTEAAKRTAVFDAIVVTLTRNNFIYERDLSITMTLVANNNAIIFINSDSFDNNNAGTLINQSQTVIDGAIGSANYDIGHTFSTGGGGLASLNSPCVNGNKARGITGLPAPVGDAYDIDFVAHELGHQYGSPHTFNGNAGNCAGGNRSASNAYEVGSGTTIMAYAGICAPQNVQNNSDAYFHQRSLVLIFNNVFSGASTCANQSVTGNIAPIAEAGVNYTVPISTPYKLTGTSTDVDGTGSHTFTWEQYDLGASGIPVATNTGGPMVRSFEGTSNPTRFIPNLNSLLTSNGGGTTWEVLPSVNRTQNFRLTVRDNDSRGGNTAVDNMTVTFSNSAGPFRVTSQNVVNSIVWTPGTTETITWNVAGTNAGVTASPNVNIRLSTDGGLTYPTILATNTLNDGSHTITVPNITAPYCRVMVEAATNIFFNINSQDFAIGNYTYTTVNQCVDYTINPNTSVPESNTQFTVFNINVPDSATITDVNVGTNLTHNNSGDIFIAVIPPFNTTQVRMVSGACVGPQNAVIVSYDDEGAATNCADTDNNDAVLPVEALNVFDGQNSAGNWRYLITDINIGDGNIATLNSATINICSTSVEPVLSTSDFTLEDDGLLIYPNPNNGEFTVSLSSAKSNSVSIDVLDIRGRKVFSNNFDANGSLKQTINLGKVQSGMYLISVQDGNNKITKKIMINN
ncbi:zinc-dependent metalloprotease [Aurantibacter aestuarii]|uniref:P/Homo B domain-containing protein n=1 Tax=Aurantibacter aestuarii TaxID=1266046 RepID=A0A2T1NDI4_9FLAO|nr:zinc-dependent metalloprotease family protein [Aurantibacter aestuarii]PSG90498.1 hypothetical protein C7H52_04240 [Aurantibacter aestuarii]